MSAEFRFIEMMREVAVSPEARGLDDDVAILQIGGERLIVTHDMMVEGVHWPDNADASDVAWRLVASNLSDLAAKGARPIGVVLGYMLGSDEWDQRFFGGMVEATQLMKVPLLGGDTVSNGKKSGPRSLGMTALGLATHSPVPSRSGAQAGQGLFVTGTLGDALAGFELDRSGDKGPPDLLAAYWWPKPQIEFGQKLVPLVSAMMDVSDGLLLDAKRMAEASGLALEIDISSIPLSTDYISQRTDNLDSRIQAASWGDDYQLLFAAPTNITLPVPATKVGYFHEGSGLTLTDAGTPIPLPASLGYQHS